MNKMWTEEFRPKGFADYVFKDAKQKLKLEQWIKQGALPHCSFSGPPGSGKTTLAKVLLHELNIDPFDVLEVNASRDNGVDFIRETITRFAETMGVGDMRYVLLDEADYLSVSAQAVLRNTMEKYADSVRFILTSNYQHKLIPAIMSRCEAGKMTIDKLDRDEFTLRLCNILMAKSIEFDIDDVDSYVDMSYPDLRRGISLIQSNSIDGVLTSHTDAVETIADYKLDMIALFRSKQYTEARKLICAQVQQDEYDDMFRFMYQNIDVWSEGDANKENRAIIVIRDGIVKDTQCADREINLSAMFCELELVAKGIF